MKEDKEKSNEREKLNNNALTLEEKNEKSAFYSNYLNG